MVLTPTVFDEQDIVKFQVLVTQLAVVMQVSEGTAQLEKQIACFLLGDRLAVDIIQQVVGTVVADNIDSSIRLEYLMKADNVGMVKTLPNVELAFKAKVLILRQVSIFA